MVVEIVSEQLDVADGRCGDFGRGEVTREEDKRDVSYVFGIRRP